MADLALSWKDHHNVLISVFEKLLEQKTLVDCTLAAEGKFLKAHKIVLSACSPYLEALLNQENDKHPIIFLRDVQFEDLKTLVEFVYSGEIKITEDRLVEFLSVAEALQIKGLGGSDNEVSSKKSVSESTRKRRTFSPVTRKRSRRHSNESDGKPEEKHDEEIGREISETQQIHVNHMNISSVRCMRSSHRKSIVTEGLTPSIIKIKEEVANTLSGVSVHFTSEQSQPELAPNESTEEILGLKPEFEQVTFTEEYSDLLPEDEGSVEHIPDPDQPSSSQEYSGFSSDPVASGGLAVESPFMVTSGEQRPSEGFITFVKTPPLSVALSRKPSPLQTRAARREGAAAALSNANTSAGTMDPLAQRYSCSFCPKTCSSVTALRVHVRVHTGEKPYQCEYCDMCFSQSGSLKRHRRTHTNEKPYQCVVCAKRFRSKSNMMDHMSVHTGKRQHVCKDCGRSFARRGPLWRHMEEAHGNS